MRRSTTSSAGPASLLVLLALTLPFDVALSQTRPAIEAPGKAQTQAAKPKSGAHAPSGYGGYGGYGSGHSGSIYRQYDQPPHGYQQPYHDQNKQYGYGYQQGYGQPYGYGQKPGYGQQPPYYGQKYGQQPYYGQPYAYQKGYQLHDYQNKAINKPYGYGYQPGYDYQHGYGQPYGYGKQGHGKQGYGYKPPHYGQQPHQPQLPGGYARQHAPGSGHQQGHAQPGQAKK